MPHVEEEMQNETEAKTPKEKRACYAAVYVQLQKKG